MSDSKDIIVKLRLLVKPPINIKNFYYKVTYTKFGYQTKDGKHTSPKAINNGFIKFTANPSANKNGLLAIDSEAIVLLQHNSNIKKISFPDAKNGSAWFQIENRSNGKVVKMYKYPQWSYRNERKTHQYLWDTTSSKNSTTPDTQKIQQIKQKCPHTVDGAIEVAKYIVDEIKRNVKSLEAQRIRYHLTGEVGDKLKKSFNDIDASIAKVKAQTGRAPYGYSRNPNTLTAGELWVKQVDIGKDWDHKPLIKADIPNLGLNQLTVHRPLRSSESSVESRSHFHKYKDYDYYYDVWSNIHYGYVGLSVGFNENTLIKGSNFQQFLQNLKGLTLGADTPDDRTTMEMGFALFPLWQDSCHP